MNIYFIYAYIYLHIYVYCMFACTSIYVCILTVILEWIEYGLFKQSLIIPLDISHTFRICYMFFFGRFRCFSVGRHDLQRPHPGSEQRGPEHFGNG